MKKEYKGRPISYRYEEGVLIVWLSKNPLEGFEVKRKNEQIFAYAFEGNFSIEEIGFAKRIFKEYEGL
jgi:hypothetical protein